MADNKTPSLPATAVLAVFIGSLWPPGGLLVMALYVLIVVMAKL